MREPGYEGLRTLLRNMPFYAAVVDREFRFLWANRFDPTLGEEAVIGKSPRDFVTDAQEEMVVEAMEAAFATGETQRYEVKGYGHGDFETYYETWVIPFEDQGQTLLFLLTADATERHRAQRNLKLALDAGNIGLWEWDLVTDAFSLGVTVAELLGVELAELPARRAAWEAMIHPDDREAVRNAVARHVEGEGTAFQVEYRVIADGDLVCIFERGRVVHAGADGQPLRAIGTHVDVTELRRETEERKELTAQLWQAQKMETVGRLAGGVAHDFNNLLMVIRGQLEFAREAFEVGEGGGEELDDIGAAAARATELTQQLLSFSRREHHHPRVVALGGLVEGAMRMLRRTVPASIELAFERRAEGSIYADPRQLEQVLLNLCINARDAMGGRGTIVIRVDGSRIEEGDPRCAALGRKPGDYLVLSVGDDGEGMSSERAARIFEPFFTSKPTGEGTGLGLAVVHGIIEQHGGFVEVDSAPGEGSTFAVYLLEHRGEVDEAVEQRTTLLVAEDEAVVRRLMVKIFRYAGYRVLEAEDGDVALRVFREHAREIDLVVLDVVMPGRSGREVFEDLRRQRTDLPVLFCSGYSDERPHLPDERVRHLTKPAARETLLTAVAELLERAHVPREV